VAVLGGDLPATAGCRLHPAGTVARVENEVERQAPITLVIPLIREKLGH